MKGVEKKEGKDKWNQKEIASKRKTVTEKRVASNATPKKQSPMMVNVQTNTVSAIKTVAERTKEQGEGYLDDESMLKTLVEAQWVLKLGSTTFNVRAALLALLKRMATVNNTIYLKT
eukprot:4471330-Ditylum_brightwellii.AAC.1